MTDTFPPPKYTPEQLKRRNRRWIVGIVVGLLVVGGCTALVSLAPSKGSESGAESVCREFVEDRLKAPATAEFSRLTVYASDENEWTVSGLVDSQNGFGAQLRSTFRCEVEHVSGSQYRLIDMAME